MTADTVIRGERPPGYRVDILEHARVRFSDVRKVVGDWGGEP